MSRRLPPPPDPAIPFPFLAVGTPVPRSLLVTYCGYVHSSA